MIQLILLEFINFFCAIFASQKTAERGQECNWDMIEIQTCIFHINFNKRRHQQTKLSHKYDDKMMTSR